MSKTRTPERARALRRFKPYPAYKDSGVEWLGQIPAHCRRTPRFGSIHCADCP